MKGLPTLVTEEELRNEVYNICGVVPTNIKIVRDKTTGECRGIGFLDFDSVDVAKKVITTTNRSMNIYEAKVTLDYSIKPAQADKKVFRDWLCDCCFAKNFGHRMRCYMCNTPKSANAQELVSQIDNEEKPTVELIVRGLNESTTDDTILHVFSAFGKVKSSRIIRDKMTQVSRRFAFVEYYTVEEATSALKQSQGIQIDGATINVSYARRNHLQGKFANPSEAIAFAAWSSAYDTDNPEVKKQAIQAAATQGYVLDKNSGYYYNAQMNYYYDQNTGYYYDANNAVWMYFDPQKVEFVKIQNDQQQQAQTSNTNQTTEAQKPEENKSTTDTQSVQKQDTKEEGKPAKTTTTPVKKETTFNPKKKKDSENIARWNKKAKELHEDPVLPPQKTQKKCKEGKTTRGISVHHKTSEKTRECHRIRLCSQSDI